MLFPRRLPVKDAKETDASVKAAKEMDMNRTLLTKDNVNSSWNSTRKSLQRLASNKIFTLNLFSNCVSIFIFSGFATFLPKFYQIWFRFRASNSGIGQIGPFLGQMSGLIGGGIFIYKVQPKATSICIWTAFGSMVMILGLFGVSYTSCTRAPWILPGDTLAQCVQDCHCEVSDYNPICIKELGLNFPSACTAGCKDFKINGKEVTYQNCNCIKKKINNTFGLSPGHPLITQSVGDLTASHGECSSNDESCYHSFYVFTGVVIILAFTKFSGQLGGLLVLLRAIDVEDKV